MLHLIASTQKSLQISHRFASFLLCTNSSFYSRQVAPFERPAQFSSKFSNGASARSPASSGTHFRVTKTPVSAKPQLERPQTCPSPQPESATPDNQHDATRRERESHTDSPPPPARLERLAGERERATDGEQLMTTQLSDLSELPEWSDEAFAQLDGVVCLYKPAKTHSMQIQKLLLRNILNGSLELHSLHSLCFTCLRSNSDFTFHLCCLSLCVIRISTPTSDLMIMFCILDSTFSFIEYFFNFTRIECDATQSPSTSCQI